MVYLVKWRKPLWGLINWTCKICARMQSKERETKRGSGNTGSIHRVTRSGCAVHLGSTPAAAHHVNRSSGFPHAGKPGPTHVPICIVETTLKVLAPVSLDVTPLCRAVQVSSHWNLKSGWDLSHFQAT